MNNEIAETPKPNGKFFVFMRDLIDNDTLIILGVLALAALQPGLADKVVAGLFALGGFKARDLAK